MTTYNTGNPIGSTAVKDLYDNAENLDTAVNTRTAESWSDRFGVARKTWWGMEQDFQQFLLDSGYVNIGDYGPGLEITERNQIFWRDGELYRASAALELPYTTTGDWGDEEGLFVAVGDQALRQELSQSGGAAMIGAPDGGMLSDIYGEYGIALFSMSMVSIESVDSLYTFPSAHRKEGLLYIAKGYFNDNQIGGGVFFWDPTSVQENDGGVIIQPNDIISGPGRWVRSIDGWVSPEMFGARCDGISDDYEPFQAAVNKYGDVRLARNRSYYIGSTINIPSFRKISGTFRRGAVIRVRGIGGLSAVGQDIELEGFSIVCDREEGSSFGLRVLGPYFTARDLHIDHGATDGSKKFNNCVIVPSGSEPWVHLYDNCVFTSSSSHAFFVSASAAGFNHVLFSHCTFRSAGEDGFNMQASSSHGISFVACRAENNQRDGFSIAGRRGNQVSFLNPYTEHNGRDGILLGDESPSWTGQDQYMEPCSISGATSWEDKRSGVHVYKCAYANISGISIGSTELENYRLGGIVDGWPESNFPLSGYHTVVSGAVLRGQAIDFELYSGLPRIKRLHLD